MKKLLPLLFLPLLFLGCSSEVTNSTTTTTTYPSYFPLVAGRIVTYEVWDHTEVPVMALAMLVTDEATVETWQYSGPVPLTATLEVFKINVITGGTVVPYYYREDGSGVYRYGSGAVPTTEATVWLKYPLTIGATWESGNIWWPHGFVSQESVSTGAGTFNCKSVDLKTFPGTWDNEWFAADVGLIKEYSGYGGAGTRWASREVSAKNF